MKLNGVDINKIKIVVHDSMPEKYANMDPTSISKGNEVSGYGLGKLPKKSKTFSGNKSKDSAGTLLMDRPSIKRKQNISRKES